MSSEIEILIKLKTQLVTFLDELIESFPGESDFVIFRIFVKDRIPIVDVMNYIVEKLCPLQEMVKQRKEDFFTKNNVLFESFNDSETSKVNYFQQLWLSGQFDKQDKEIIWQWFTRFISLGNQYKESRRKDG